MFYELSPPVQEFSQFQTMDELTDSIIVFDDNVSEVTSSTGDVVDCDQLSPPVQELSQFQTMDEPTDSIEVFGARFGDNESEVTSSTEDVVDCDHKLCNLVCNYQDQIPGAADSTTETEKEIAREIAIEMNDIMNFSADKNGKFKT